MVSVSSTGSTLSTCVNLLCRTKRAAGALRFASAAIRAVVLVYDGFSVL